MESCNNLEVVLYSEDSLTSSEQKEIMKWWTASVQPVIERQQESAKTLVLPILNHTPDIYLS